MATAPMYVITEQAKPAAPEGSHSGRSLSCPTQPHSSGSARGSGSEDEEFFSDRQQSSSSALSSGSSAGTFSSAVRENNHAYVSRSGRTVRRKPLYSVP